MTPKDIEWFKAVDRFDTAQMDALLAAGVSVNATDKRGRTALFYVVAPFGGRPGGVAWLIERRIDVNVRDDEGQSAVQFGRKHVTSGLEAGMARHNEALCREAGYVDDVADVPKRRSRRRGRKRR